MKKVTVSAPRTHEEDLLQFLQEESVLHIVNSSLEEYSSKESDISTSIAQLQFVIDFIEATEKEVKATPKRSWKNLFAGKPTASLAELEDTARAINVSDLVTQANALHDAMTANKEAEKTLDEQSALIEPWTSLDVPAHPAPLTTPVIHLLLSFTIHEESVLHDALALIPTGVWQEVGRVAQKKSIHIFGELVAHQKDADAVAEFENTLEAERTVLPFREDESLSAYRARIVKEHKQKQQEYKELIQQASTLLPLKQDILFTYDALLNRVEREQVLGYVQNTPFSTTVSGWIPATWLAEFTKKVEQRFTGATVEEAIVAEDDRMPVMLQNSKWIRPFETITNLYGKPQYHEIDPTGPLAIFFLTSFGLALTDAGYGIVLMVGTFVAERFFKLKKDMQKMARLLFYAGAITVVLGAVTGGWFSISLEILPEGPIKHFLLGVKLMDPLKQPILLLGLIFVFGILQLLYAWVVRGIHHWKEGQKAIAIMDDFSWVAMVGSIIIWQTFTNIPSLNAYTSSAKYVMYAMGIFMIATQGRATKNIFLKFGNGVMSLYGLIAFVSDMLSYSRLLALGLATGIIGLVVNLIAGMVWPIPFIGVIAAIVVLIGGHIFNLAINALGAYIHSSRLQFVEFFPKFLEGGGLPFQPFGRVSKYVDNPKDYMKVV